MARPRHSCPGETFESGPQQPRSHPAARGLRCGVGMDRREKLIFIVSGEASGDNLAGRLMGALKRETGGRIRFAGVGGPQSSSQGLVSLFPMSDLSVMGLAEVLPHLPRLVRRLNETTAE